MAANISVYINNVESCTTASVMTMNVLTGTPNAQVIYGMFSCGDIAPTNNGAMNVPSVIIGMISMIVSVVAML